MRWEGQGLCLCFLEWVWILISSLESKWGFYLLALILVGDECSLRKLSFSFVGTVLVDIRILNRCHFHHPHQLLL